MAWLLPELDEGVEPELNPLELLDELELFELLVLFELFELFELELLELLELLVDVPELVLDELELLVDLLLEPVDADAVCVDPGRARATAPAVTTLAMPTAVVVDRTLLRPRSLTCAARRILSRFML